MDQLIGANPVAYLVLGGIGVLGLTLFLPSEKPADRLERLIRAWRKKL